MNTMNCSFCGKETPAETRVTFSVSGRDSYFCSTNHFTKFTKELKRRFPKTFQKTRKAKTGGAS